MKSIYIVLSYTGTLPSKLIKTTTGHTYSHISIALNEDLSEMYSFGRIYTYFPWYGGFIQEDIHSGLYRRMKKSKIAVYRLTLDGVRYEKVTQKIREFEVRKKQLTYDFLGAAGMKVGKDLFRSNGYVCSSFAYDVLTSGEIKFTKERYKVFPMDFLAIPGMSKIYEGLASDYR